MAWTAEDFDFDFGFGGEAPIKSVPAAKPMSAWQRFKNAYLEGAVNSEFGGAAFWNRLFSDEPAAQTDAKYRRVREDLEKKRLADDEHFKNVDTLSPANIGRLTVDLAGNMLGGVDPTYVLGPGRTAVQRVLAQMGINAGADAASQGIQLKRGIRDEYDPWQTGINAVAGAGIQGGQEIIRGARLGRSIRRGTSNPSFAELERTMLSLEGGGTLENPKTSPKGAKGPYQVMDATARDPGFGIRPWNGKTEADRARVGRQYLAVMTDRYDGDTAKILAAYNAGPGRVDAAVKKHGANWLRHMPDETRKYVTNGFHKMGRTVDIAEREPEVDPKFLLRSAREEADAADLKKWEEISQQEKIRADLMRQAEDDNSFVKFEQPDQGDQNYANWLLGPSNDLKDYSKADSPLSALADDLYLSGLYNTQADALKGARSKWDISDESWNSAIDFVAEEKGVSFDDIQSRLNDPSTFKEVEEASKYYAKKEAEDFEQKPWDPEEWLDEEDFDGDDIDLDIDEPTPHYDYIGSPEPYQKFYEKYGVPISPSVQNAIDEIAATKGVHPFDIAEAHLFQDSSTGWIPEEITKQVQKLVKANKKGSSAEYYSKTSDEEIKPSYDYLGVNNPFDEFHEKMGVPVDPDWKMAIEDIAFKYNVHPYDVAEALFNKDSVKGLNVEKISAEVEEKAVNLYHSKKYDDELESNKSFKVTKPIKPSFEYKDDEWAALTMEQKDKSIELGHEALGHNKWKDKLPKSKGERSRFAKAGETFLRMLKDESGKGASPESLHRAITEWDKGTHHLLKGPDGTPLRIYHGTRKPYEGMPAGAKNYMPPGYVMYSTNPKFASDYAAGGEASRVFPAYVKNSKDIGDFRKPEDLKKAIDWYKKKYGEELRWGTEEDLADGRWTSWEKPDMLKDLGWRGVYLTESNSLNLMLKDDLVLSLFDPSTYKNNTLGHKIVRTLKALLKDESGSYRMRPFDDSVDPASAEGKLIAAVKGAKKASAETRALYRQAKAEKAGELDKLQQEGGGLDSYYKQLSVLKGQLPKADWESIRDNFTDEEIKELVDKINFNKILRPLEKVKTITALHKLLGVEGSKVPTAGDIKLLSQVYSNDFIQALMDNRPLMEKFWRGVGNAVSLPRSFMSSGDLSAPFRQGLNMIHKKEFWTAFAHMFKLFGSKKASDALWQEIHQRPTYDLMKKANLAIMNPESHFLLDREENFMSNWAEGRVSKALLVGHGVAASNRAYTGFLNKLRADVFDSLVKKYEKAGINLATDPQKLRRIGSFINAATGRGSLGKWGNNAAPALASVFFSPRLIASRVQMFNETLNPVSYIRKDPIMRKEALKAALSMGAYAATVVGLAKMGLDMAVEDDPRSSDFGKLKTGNTRYDYMGGYQQYLTLFARLATGETMTSKGEIKQLDGKGINDTRRDTFLKFGINKLSPVASFISDMLEGKDPTGKDFEVDEAVLKRFVPMFAQDLAEVMKEEGYAKGAAMAAPGAFGIGVQSYDPYKRDEEKAAKKAAEAPLSDEFSSEFSSDDFDFGEFEL